MTLARPAEHPRTFPNPRETVGGRVAASILAAACLAVLLVAAWLTPAPAGHGSHTQIGLPPCGWAVYSGRPCPTCGMTTAFALAAEGRWARATTTQPLGALLALTTAVVFWFGAYVAATGSLLGRMGATMVGPRVLWTLAGLLLAAWAYKMLTWPAG